MFSDGNHALLSRKITNAFRIQVTGMFRETYNLNQSLNFSNKNLQGRSFKDQNLEGVDFSGSDIRGANFAGANLTNADLSDTKAGLTNYWTIVSFLLALVTGFLMGSIAYTNCKLLYSGIYNNQIVGAIALTGCITFLIVSLREGFANAFIKVLATIAAIGILPGIISVAFNLGELGDIALNAAYNLVLNIFAAIIITFFLTFMITVTNTNAVINSLIISVITAISIPVLDNEVIANPIAQNGWFAITITAGIAVLIMLLCADISRRVLAGDDNHAFIRRIAIAIAAIDGTNFREANLSGANFTGTNLRNTVFIKATLTHTIWHKAKLGLARLDNTILDNPAVRDLLVNKNPYINSYENACLEGAYLVGLDLKYVNFKNANLSKANLMGANLSNANFTEANLQTANLQTANLEDSTLTKIQAIGTDFTQAYFTGACGLETWNIDGTTKLDGVNCRFVYLDENPKIKQNKRPQSGEFSAGEFTKFFQVVVNTVDLIFRNGLDLEALCATLKDVQAKQNTPLKIQNIENKGQGFVVVKVSVSEQADKTKIHSELKQSYQQQLKLIEARHQAELQGKQEQIEIYRQQAAQMTEITKLLAAQDARKPQIQVQADKLVVLIIGEGDFANGFPVTAQIWTNEHPRPITFTSKLPAEPKIPQLYQRCQQLYRSQQWFARITLYEEDCITNFSIHELVNYARELEESLNHWLNSQPFSLIEKELRAKLIPSEEVAVIIQTKNIQLQSLPWHLWNFFEHYQQTEVALSPIGNRKEKFVPQRNQIRILTILGNSAGIDVKADRLVLQNLLNVETTFLVEPTRKELHEYLWDEQGWDILCYSGHSFTQADGSIGSMLLNQTDLLTIRELKNALKKAIERGLQLAIFNSCDGLGLARELGDLYIPQMIVMREAVPDKVAQEFLKYFLSAFSSGKSLYTSVREARERLESLEDEFPYASWLPMIFQNSAEVGMSWGNSQR
jgi:uncharacterized protein YjbI with pentapeptide repeats